MLTDYRQEDEQGGLRPIMRAEFLHQQVRQDPQAGVGGGGCLCVCVCVCGGKGGGQHGPWLKCWLLEGVGVPFPLGHDN